MLKLAVECADGVFTNFLPLDAMPDIAAQLKGAPEKFDLVHRFLCFPADRQEDRDEMEAVARSIFTAYVTVPVYEKHCRSLGYGDLIDPMVNAWRSGDRKAALQLAPWEAIEQLFLVGTPGQIKSKLEAYVDAGVTVPIVVAYVPPRRLDAAIDALAP
jgi:alkanesulfonate monooxygenase SsuD/methylene tetrahydromethanopterin reductase-like flavin-dependent oxidoreductase (luciferase family)